LPVRGLQQRQTRRIGPGRCSEADAIEIGGEASG